MGQPRIDWPKIRLDYITDTSASYRSLSEKYGVSYQAICHRSKDEGWIAQREQHANETISKAADMISDKKADKMARIDDLADKLLEKLEQAITELDVQLYKHVDKTKVIEYNNAERPDKPTKEIVHEEEKIVEVTSIVDRRGLQQIASALKDLKEVKMIRSEADMREQEARIKSLNMKNGEERDNELIVVMGDAEQYAG